MPLSEFIEESWKLALYGLMVFVFILSLLYAWHNYQGSLECAEGIREARMQAVGLLNLWGEDGVVDTSKVSEDDLPENTAVSFHNAEGTLLKAVGEVETQNISLKVPVVVDGEEGYMILSVGW
jgi:hypothetical protein